MTMIRNLVLIALAILISFSLTIAGGYAMYHFSAAANEYQLGWFANHLFNPIVAVIVGLLIGSFSRSHAVIITVLGLMPWALSLNIYGCRPIAAAAGALIELEILGAVAAVVSWKFFHKPATQHPVRSDE